MVFIPSKKPVQDENLSLSRKTGNKYLDSFNTLNNNAIATLGGLSSFLGHADTVKKQALNVFASSNDVNNKIKGDSPTVFDNTAEIRDMFLYFGGALVLTLYMIKKT